MDRLLPFLLLLLLPLLHPLFLPLLDLHLHFLTPRVVIAALSLEATGPSAVQMTFLYGVAPFTTTVTN